MADHQYHLKTGAEGEQQLDNLDYFFGDTSRQFLQQIGLQPGMHVLDVGCGVGNLSIWLAQQVGPEGKVVAVDNNAQQIESASKRAQKLGLQNIQFAVADAHDLALYQNQFDLAYCRWLLVHVHDPKTVIEQMANTVRDGGVVSFEVGDMYLSGHSPEFAEFNELNAHLRELMRLSGNDLEISKNVVSHCKALNAFDVNVQLSQQVLHEPQKIDEFTHNYILLLDSVSESLLQHNLLSKQQLQAVRQQFSDYHADQNTLLFLARMTQVYCRKAG